MTVGTGVYHSISPPFVCILGKIFSAKGASGVASEPLLQAGNVESMRTQKFINLLLRLKLNHANWAILLIIRTSALKYCLNFLKTLALIMWTVWTRRIEKGVNEQKNNCRNAAADIAAKVDQHVEFHEFWDQCSSSKSIFKIALSLKVQKAHFCDYKYRENRPANQADLLKILAFFVFMTLVSWWSIL